MPSIVLYFHSEKKHSVRYDAQPQANGDRPLFSSAYLEKSTYNMLGKPKHLHVSVRSATLNEANANPTIGG